jgi:hypothetical protein
VESISFTCSARDSISNNIRPNCASGSVRAVKIALVPAGIRTIVHFSVLTDIWPTYPVVS